MARRFSYRFFDVAVRRRIELSPSMVRFVFSGDDLQQARTFAPDQRIKVFFPTDGGHLSVPEGDDWQARYRELPDTERPPVRTYTIRAVRAELAEMDVDFVAHGDQGPATRWALRAKPGDRIRLLAPHAGERDDNGYEWKPPAGVRDVLLVADETALPAVAGILEELAASPQPPRVRAFIEVPVAGDEMHLTAPANASVVWVPRADTLHSSPAACGVRLLDAIRAADLSRQSPPALADRALPLPEIDIDRQILWERAGAADAEPSSFYAWIAGEAGVVMSIRRHLVGERGYAKSDITFMGYWRQGRALD